MSISPRINEQTNEQTKLYACMPHESTINRPPIPFSLIKVPEGGTVQCVGQALAVVLADSADTARAAARTVVVTYEDTGAKPVLSFVEGIERKSFLPPGNVKAISVRFVCVFGVLGWMDGWIDG